MAQTNVEAESESLQSAMTNFFFKRCKRAAASNLEATLGFE